MEIRIPFDSHLAEILHEFEPIVLAKVSEAQVPSPTSMAET